VDMIWKSESTSLPKIFPLPAPPFRKSALLSRDREVRKYPWH
jgi:hypothetical protein